MKKLLFTFVLISILSIQVMAATKNVTNTVHNLSKTSSGTIKATNVSEVCVFCHTPHAAAEWPLWNRDTEMRGSQYVAFLFYSTTYATPPFYAGYETLLCMSCHDGITSMKAIHNNPNTLVGSINMTADNFMSNPGSFADIGNPDEYANIDVGVSTTNAESYYGSGGVMVFKAITDPVSGRGLGDHPISINYQEVRTKAPAKYNVKPATLRFFGTDRDQLECSTCHDPHVDYNAQQQFKPFLAYSNRSSALCFQCHVK